MNGPKWTHTKRSICWKSGAAMAVHRTGTAGLVYNLYKTIKYFIYAAQALRLRKYFS